MTHTILAFSTRYPIAAAGMPSSAASSNHHGESHEMLQKNYMDCCRPHEL
jgi:hypothetical protein